MTNKRRKLIRAHQAKTGRGHQAAHNALFAARRASEGEGGFPFGSPLRSLAQEDRSPKRVSVLGVYASAVHARWFGGDGKLLVQALAVASEPVIFWNGANAAEILAAIELAERAGRLEPAAAKFNGPSGRSLDDDFLEPLGLDRKDAWLCCRLALPRAPG